MEDMTLQPFTHGHHVVTKKWLADRMVCHGVLRTPPKSLEEDTRWFLEFIAEDNRIDYAIYAKDKGYIGNISLRHIDWQNMCGEMLIYIGEEENRARGYATKAVKRFVDICFDDYQIHKIYATVAENNIIARHLYNKCEFVQEGVLKEAFRRNGEYINVVKMARINGNLPGN